MPLLTSNRFTIFFLVVCVSVGFLLRLNIFDATGSNFYFVDVARDYIVSNHMAAYGEVPLTGSDGYAGSYLSSPIYYYILAFFLLFNDNVFFPGLVNIVLQTLSIVVVFFLAKEMFGRKTACLATVFFTFFDAIIGQSFIMWQPYLMQPFLLGSLYLLVLAFKRHKNILLYASGLLFAIACMLHNSAVAILPVYASAAGLILFYHKERLSTYFKAILSFTVPIILMSLPVFIYFSYYYVEPTPLSGAESLYLVPNPFFQLEFVNWSFSFVERSAYLFSFLFEGTVESLNDFTPSSYTYLCMLAFLIGSIVYVLQSKTSYKIYYFIAFWSCILFVSAAIATLGILPEFEFPVRYFTPVYVMVLILAAEIIVSLFKKYTWTIVPKVVIVMVLLTFASSLPTSIKDMVTKINENGPYAFTPAYTPPDDVLALAEVLKKMDVDTGVFPAFDVRTFKNDYEDQYMDSLIWFPLEKIFGMSLVKVDDVSFRGFAVERQPDHLFVRCLANTRENCKYNFLRKYNLKYEVIDIFEASTEVFYLHAVRI